MRKLIAFPIVLCIVAASVGLSSNHYSAQETESSAAKQEKETKQEKEKEVPIDEQFVEVDNMHHFMEYICEPSYKGLKATLATEPLNRRAWKPFKNHALVLAETATMVAARAPEDEAKAKEWKTIALAVHKTGTALYKSAGKYDQAKKHYGLMIDQCNKCHTVFAEGKYQLEK